MATLSDIAYAVATELGRPELVVDYANGDYTPTSTLLRLINAAQRHLDRFVEQPDEKRQVAIALSEGQYIARVPDTLQYIDRVDIEDDTDRTLLEKREYQYMRDEYAQPFNLVQSAKPADWSRLTPSDYVERNLISNGTFDSSVSPWTQTQATLAWDSGAAKLTCTGFLIPSAGMKYSFLASDGSTPNPQDITQTTLTFDLTDASYTALASVVVWITGDGRTLTYTFPVTLYDPIQSYTVSMLQTVPDNVANGTYTEAQWAATMAACVSVEIRAIGGVGDWIKIDNVVLMNDLAKIGNLLILPPADKAYTMYVIGNYYVPRLAKNSDSSWWSYNHPDILITSTKRQVAVNLNRNQTEMAEYDAQIMPALYEIEKQTAAEEQSGGHETTQFGWE